MSVQPQGNINSTLDNLLRLSWDSLAEYQKWHLDNAHMITQIWLWHETVGNREGAFQFPGICSICKVQTTFSMQSRKADPGDTFAFRTDWWMRAQCTCEMSALDRSVLQLLFESCGADTKIYHVGEHSPFRRWLANRLPNVVSSQFEPGRRPGEIIGGVRYEDLTSLSFSNESFDCSICMEILEHVPDYNQALRELARTLTPGGRVLLSFPWLGGTNYEHLTRAVMNADGSITHLLPPEYHGDPAQPDDGILSFRAFGWKILDELRDAGFSKASAKVVFGPLHGFYSALNPVIVGIR
jgi:SAM-dependent methyltransferase